MKKLVQFVHDNQIVVAALILFLAVLVYCLFNRYDMVRLQDSVIMDHLVGNIHNPRECLIRHEKKQ